MRDLRSRRLCERALRAREQTPLRRRTTVARGMSEVRGEAERSESAGEACGGSGVDEESYRERTK